MMTRYGKAVWLGLFLLIAVYFGFFEWKALSEPDGLTLSHFIYNASHAWALFAPLLCLGIGILLSHFFWEWSPKLQTAQKTIADLARQLRAERDRADGLDVELRAARQRAADLEFAASQKRGAEPEPKPKARRK